MKLAFYKSTSSSAELYDKLITFWTGSVYSHVEIIFSNGLSFSSSPRDGGCRYKAIVYNDDSWDYINLQSLITPEREAEIMAFCDSQNGKKYDWLGIFLSQFMPLGIEDPKRWFCSELGAKIMMFYPPSSYNPRKLYERVIGELK